MGRARWYKPLTPALGPQREEDLCEVEANLVSKESSRATQDYLVRPCLQTKQNWQKQTHKQTHIKLIRLDY